MIINIYRMCIQVYLYKDISKYKKKLDNTNFIAPIKEKYPFLLKNYINRNGSFNRYLKFIDYNKIYTIQEIQEI